MWLHRREYFKAEGVTLVLTSKKRKYVPIEKESEVAQLCLTLHDPMDPTRLLHPWDFPGKSTGEGCHFFRDLYTNEYSGSTSILHNLNIHQLVKINCGASVECITI